MILLDTDVCIELLKGNERVLQRRDQYDGPVGICFMTIAELYYGAEKSKEPTKNIDTIEKLLLSLEIIQTDIPILKRFGTIKADLQKQGMPVADADVLIAATTLEKAERLVTGNAKHFERIAGLVLEDWR
ncbi:MAG: PIN domain-containing protein [Spirochaetia bacterium]|jgi:tRNA(fMet)-specific endonuclease VapC